MRTLFIRILDTYRVIEFWNRRTVVDLAISQSGCMYDYYKFCKSDGWTMFSKLMVF